MTILRDATHARHRAVEALPVIQDLLQARMSPQHYLRYLQELWCIYTTLEELAESRALLEGLPDIQRRHYIREDIQELGGDTDRAPTPAGQKYLEYLRDLVRDPANDPRLMAHVYVRHMGDLYGGKILARQVPGSGRAYQFQDRPGLIREFNLRLTTDMGDEANRAFDWFIEIFQELSHELGSGGTGPDHHTGR